MPASRARRRTMYHASTRDMDRSDSLPVRPMAARNSGPFLSPAIPAAAIYSSRYCSSLLRQLQLCLRCVLPKFAAQTNPNKWMLREALRELRKPALIENMAKGMNARDRNLGESGQPPKLLQCNI